MDTRIFVWLIAKVVYLFKLFHNVILVYNEIYGLVQNCSKGLSYESPALTLSCSCPSERFSKFFQILIEKTTDNFFSVCGI